MSRSMKLFTGALLLSALSLGCSPGLSTPDAEARCDEQRTVQQGCFDDATYAQCVSCFEACGDTCAIAESCPVQYVCSDADGAATGGGAQ